METPIPDPKTQHVTPPFRFFRRVTFVSNTLCTPGRASEMRHEGFFFRFEVFPFRIVYYYYYWNRSLGAPVPHL